MVYGRVDALAATTSAQFSTITPVSHHVISVLEKIAGREVPGSSAWQCSTAGPTTLNDLVDHPLEVGSRHTL
jgi:hypothetical protein